MKNNASFYPQQGCAAFLQLALLFLDVDDVPSARVIVSEGLALCSGSALDSLRDLEAVLNLSLRCGRGRELSLPGHHVSLVLDSIPSELPAFRPAPRFIN